VSGQVGHRRRVLSGEGRELPSSLVRAMVVVVTGVGVQHVPGMSLVADQQVVESVTPEVPVTRSQWAFIRGCECRKFVRARDLALCLPT
jgi:hypothetical protein